MNFLRSRLKRQASKRVDLLDIATVLLSDDLDGLGAVALNEANPVLIVVQSDGTLRAADDLDGGGHALGEVELEGEIVTALLVDNA